MVPDAKIQFELGTTNVPIVFEIGNQLQQYLNIRLKQGELPFAGSPDTDFRPAVNHSTGVISGPPVYLEVPKCGINCYIHPGGASRFGRGLFLIAHEHMPDLLQAAWGVSWDGTGPIPQASSGVQSPVVLRYLSPEANTAFRLLLQTPIQLDVTREESDDPRQLWLCPFVDERFRVLHTPLNPATLNVKSSTQKTWSSVAGSITGLISPSSVYTQGSVANELLHPDPGYFSTTQSAAYAIDHIAYSTGRKAVFDADSSTFSLTTADDALTQYNAIKSGYRNEQFPIILGEPGGNPASPDPSDFVFNSRKTYDYYDNNGWEKTDATSGTASGESGTPNILSTYYLQYFGGSVDSQSYTDWNNLIGKLADEYRKWQQAQFCVTYAEFPSYSGLLSSAFTDYTYIKIDCDGDTPRVTTTHQSYPVGLLPNVNICQQELLYRHNQELARITVSQQIYAGATSGDGDIYPNKSVTAYDGDTQDIGFSLLAPAADTIPAGTVLSCYFQSNAGWFAIQEGASTGGPGGSPWIQFRVLSPVGNQESGKWRVTVLQHRHTANLPGREEPSPITCGTEQEVHDVKNAFADVVFADNVNVTKCVSEDPAAPSLWKAGSVGTAFWRTPTTSCDVPEDTFRWEVETCTQSINEIRGQLVESCLKKNGQVGVPGNGTGIIGITDTDYWNISQNPAVDFPMEFTDAATEASHCWELAVNNPEGLHAVEGTTLRVRRRSEKRTSLPINNASPHSQGALIDPYWEVYMVENDDYHTLGKFANWIRVELVDGSGGDLFGPNGSWNILNWYEGTDPRVGTESSSDGCRPSISCGFDCSCLEGGDTAYAFFDENLHAYIIVSTDSALLGPPELVPIMNSWAADGCEFNWAEQTLKAFPCDNPITPKTDELDTVPLNVHTGVYRGDNNQLCFYTSEIQICSAVQVEDECVNACFPCDCDDYNCTFVYDENTGYWQPVEQCPENLPDCNCTGEAPTNTPAPGEPTTVTYPCGPTPPLNPCGPCDECTEDLCTTGFELKDVIISGNCANGDRWETDATSIEVEFDSECCWNLTIDFIQPGTALRVTKTATVCLVQSGAIMNCSMAGYPELVFTWDGGNTLAPNGACFTLPSNMGGSTPYCEGNYGLNGCGVLPTEPEVGGSWDEVQAAIGCCVPELSREQSEQLLKSAMGTHYLGSAFHTAEYQAKTVESAKPVKATAPQRLGDSFKKQYPHYFATCGCTADILPIMNRWEAKNTLPTLDQVSKVAGTLHAKLKNSDKAKITSADISQQILNFAQHFLEIKRNG